MASQDSDMLGELQSRLQGMLGADEDVEEIPFMTEGDVDEEEQREAPLVYDEDSPNLVPDFAANEKGKAELKRIANEVVDLFDAEWENTEEYRNRMIADWKIFACELEKKEFPFENSANCSVPIALENVTRLAFRTYAELFGDWTQVCGFKATAPEFDGDAEIMTAHSNWQIREQISDFKRQMHKGLLAFFMFGDVTCHSFFDDFTGLNRHEVLTPAEFVTPYTYSSTQPDYSDVPWRAKVLLRYRHELQRVKDKWSNIEELLETKAPEWSADPEQPMAEEVNKMLGREPTDDDPRAPYKLIWWEGWLELPEQENDRYCQVIVEHRSRMVLKLAIHEKADWQDKMRFDRETAELDMYRQMVEQYHAEIADHQAQVEAAQSQLGELSLNGAIGPLGEQHERGAVEALAQVPLPNPPLPPAWLEDVDPEDPESLNAAQPKAVIKRPIHLFAHGVCIEPLVGNLGLGYGRIESDFNRAANTALSQFTDSATLANVWSIITTDQTVFTDPFSIAPGKVNKVKNIQAEELRNSIIELKPQPANPQLMELVDKMYSYGQTAMQAPSVLSGEPGKSGETYRGLAARIEQATKQLSVAASKFKDFLELILRNNCFLNSVFLKDEEIIQLTDSITKRVAPIKVGRAMYEQNYKVEVQADLRFTSMAQRVAEADEIVQMGMNDPLLANNPRFRLETIKQALLARGRSDLVQLLPTPEDIAMQQQQQAMDAQQQQMAAQQQQAAPPQEQPAAQEMTGG